MIVVLSLNTAVDRTLLVPGFRTGEVFRAEEARAFAGGKGLNVARALRGLGQEVRVAGFLGGTAAPFIRERCAALGIEQRWVEIAGETRTCVIVVNPGAPQTVLNEPGPAVSAAETARLGAEIERAVAPGDFLCISGSAPPGVPDGFYADVVRNLQARGARVLVDVSGAPLRLAWEARPWAVAPNLAEYEQAFGPAAAADAASHLARRAEHVLLTLGAEGVIYAHGDTRRHVRPPPVSTRNAVGSGDAFAAGFLAGMAAGKPALEAVRLAVAAGASNAARLEPGAGSATEITALLAQVTIEDL